MKASKGARLKRARGVRPNLGAGQIEPPEEGDQVLAGQEPLDPEAAQPVGPDDEGPERKSAEPTRGVAQIDLNASVIEEATLLDAEGEELGEVIPADPATEAAGPPERTERSNEGR